MHPQVIETQETEWGRRVGPGGQRRWGGGEAERVNSYFLPRACEPGNLPVAEVHAMKTMPAGQTLACSCEMMEKFIELQDVLKNPIEQEPQYRGGNLANNNISTAVDAIMRYPL